MNKRIQELAEQAEETVSWKDFGEDGFSQVVKTEQIVNLEKFAELIVRECAKIANENVGAFTPGCGNAVLEHFGVEE